MALGRDGVISMEGKRYVLSMQSLYRNVQAPLLGHLSLVHTILLPSMLVSHFQAPMVQCEH